MITRREAEIKLQTLFHERFGLAMSYELEYLSVIPKNHGNFVLHFTYFKPLFMIHDILEKQLKENLSGYYRDFLGASGIGKSNSKKAFIRV